MANEVNYDSLQYTFSCLLFYVWKGSGTGENFHSKFGDNTYIIGGVLLDDVLAVFLHYQHYSNTQKYNYYTDVTMPLYDYHCTACDTNFEVICKISERADTHTCPECSSTDTAQCVLAGPSIGDPVRMGITQKGNGFKNVLRKIHEKTAGSMLNHTTDI